MGMIQHYKNSVASLIEKREKLALLAKEIPDLNYQVMIMDGQIRDMEARIHKLTSINATVQCNSCNIRIPDEEEETMREVMGKKICKSCLSTLSQVFTSQEAEERWNLPTGTIKQDCRRGKLDSFMQNNLIRKSGKYWIVHQLVGELYYVAKKTKQISDTTQTT